MDILKRGLAFPFRAFAWLVWVLAQQAGTTALAAMLACAVVVSFTVAVRYCPAQAFTGHSYKVLLAVTVVLFLAAITRCRA
jgi:thiol:disulfide interchange protein DsbD